MKKTLSILVALTVISSVVFARNVDNPIASPTMAVIKNGTTFKLYYKGAEQSDVKISIVDDTHRVVFSEVLKKVDGFVRPYNLSSLPEGKYTIELSNKNGKVIENINHELKTPQRFAHVHKVAGAEGKFLVTLSNKGADNITVKIFDGSNNELYKDQSEVIDDFARVYNLQKISGKFRFEISDNSGWVKSLTYLE